MWRIEQTYTPVGVGAFGELRPHYYNNYLRHCLRSTTRKVSRLCLAATGIPMDDPLNPVQISVNDSGPGARLENKECRTALSNAIAFIRRAPRMERVYNLLVIRGLSVREAGMISGLGKFTVQRDAETLANQLQDAFAKHYGWIPRNVPDVSGVLIAMRVLLEEGRIPDFPRTTSAPSKMLPFPTRGETHPDRYA